MLKNNSTSDITLQHDIKLLYLSHDTMDWINLLNDQHMQLMLQCNDCTAILYGTVWKSVELHGTHFPLCDQLIMCKLTIPTYILIIVLKIAGLFLV